MSEIIIDPVEREESPSSSVDVVREEMMWDHRGEVLIDKWMGSCFDRSKKHGRHVKLSKFKYHLFGVLSIVFPLIISVGGSPLIQYPVLQSSILLLAAIVSGISTFFNFGAKMQRHAHSEYTFFELATEIQITLCKSKKNRVAADLYIEQVKNEYTKCIADAPDI